MVERPLAGDPSLGDLKIAMPQQKAFRNYTRELVMDKGEVTVRWSDGDIPFIR